MQEIIAKERIRSKRQRRPLPTLASKAKCEPSYSYLPLYRHDHHSLVDQADQSCCHLDNILIQTRNQDEADLLHPAPESRARCWC